MKKITLLSLVAVLLTALTFTSCNTGDDNGYSLLTKEQQDAYQTKMAGSYRNLVLLFDHKNDANVKNQADSVETECYFSMRNDSTFTISNFPIKKLAEHISNPELKEAISKVEDKTVTGMYMVLPNSQTNQAYFYAYPSPINLNLKYVQMLKSIRLYWYSLPTHTMQAAAFGQLSKSVSHSILPASL